MHIILINHLLQESLQQASGSVALESGDQSAGLIGQLLN